MRTPPRGGRGRRLEIGGDGLRFGDARRSERRARGRAGQRGPDRRRERAGVEPGDRAIDRAAGEFGLAFQIVDDILDVEGESAALGKTSGKDAAAGKPTYPALYGIEQSRHMAADCLARAEATLRAAALADSRLLDIGRWIVERSN